MFIVGNLLLMESYFCQENRPLLDYCCIFVGKEDFVRICASSINCWIRACTCIAMSVGNVSMKIFLKYIFVET